VAGPRSRKRPNRFDSDIEEDSPPSRKRRDNKSCISSDSDQDSEPDVEATRNAVKQALASKSKLPSKQDLKKHTEKKATETKGAHSKGNGNRDVKSPEKLENSPSTSVATTVEISPIKSPSKSLKSCSMISDSYTSFCISPKGKKLSSAGEFSLLLFFC
jgi:hypothetical protein